MPINRYRPQVDAHTTPHIPRNPKQYGQLLMQWQKIETAPRDEQRVMVWVADGGRDRKGCHAFAHLWFYDDGSLGGGAEGFQGKWQITHWAPLLPPPTN